MVYCITAALDAPVKHIAVTEGMLLWRASGGATWRPLWLCWVFGWVLDWMGKSSLDSRECAGLLSASRSAP